MKTSFNMFLTIHVDTNFASNSNPFGKNLIRGHYLFIPSFDVSTQNTAQYHSVSRTC